MSFLDEVLLGALQGLTEFLPVSSSGHLHALQRWLDSPLAQDMTFDVLVHFATLIAVVIVFRADFAELFRGISGRDAKARRLLVHVVIGAVPAGIVGLALEDTIEELPHHWPHVISVCWLVSAGALYSLRYVPSEPDGAAEPEESEPHPFTARTALWIGCFQALALLPGISRSGITICAALWIGCRRDMAARFSFLCATPLIAGATALKVADVVKAGKLPEGSSITGYAVGGAVALVTGFFALVVLLRMLRAGALHRWAYYLVAMAIAYSAW
ncbi:MAG: undecaprenyl-diphosphate phosphatase, partial [Planctomycetota bacterium]